MSTVTVVETPEFQRRAGRLMSEDERLEMIDFIARNLMTGVSIGGGVRKFVLPVKGAARAVDTGSFTSSAPRG